MKRLLITLSILLITFFCFGQSRLYQALSDYYKVYTDVSEEFAVEISDKMEAALLLYNEIFHFDLSLLETKFKVTIYKDKSGFSRYLQRLLGQPRDDFVYIHYTDLRKSELVGFKKNNENEMISSLLHQGLIQFVKTFVPNVPIWISEGSAAYIENSSYEIVSVPIESEDEFEEEEDEFEEDEFEEDEIEEDEFSETEDKGRFILNKSLVWLDSLKALMNEESSDSILPMSELLTIDKDTAVSYIDVFYPQAWGLVFFLLNTENKAYNRLFWDSINLLDPSRSLKDNSDAVKNLILKWKDEDTLYNDYKDYILSLKTFNDYVKDGLVLYNDENYTEAEKQFQIAADLKPGHYFPYYYLGLISYANKDYYAAEDYYLKALDLGADMALTYYALGVNAYADNNYDSAVTYLNSSKEENPVKYLDKVEFLLERIESEKIDEDLYMDYEDDTESEVDTETDVDSDLEYEFEDDDFEDDEFEEDEIEEDEFEEDEFEEDEFEEDDEFDEAEFDETEFDDMDIG